MSTEIRLGVRERSITKGVFAGERNHELKHPTTGSFVIVCQSSPRSRNSALTVAPVWRVHRSGRLAQKWFP